MGGSHMRMIHTGSVFHDRDRHCDGLAAVVGVPIGPTQVLVTLLAYDKYGVIGEVTHRDGTITRECRQWGQWILFVHRADRRLDEDAIDQVVPELRNDDHSADSLVSEVILSRSRSINIMAMGDEAAEDWAHYKGFSLRNTGPHLFLPPYRFGGGWVIIDSSAFHGSDLVVGANDPGYHYVHFDWKRDFLNRLDAARRHRVIVTELPTTIVADNDKR